MKSSKIKLSENNKNGNFNITFTKKVKLIMNVREINSSQSRKTDTQKCVEHVTMFQIYAQHAGCPVRLDCDHV